MFDVLVYLYENYWRPDACPDHDQLTRKLSSVGFESDEICQQLGISTSNCHVILHRARLKLRSCMDTGWGRPLGATC